MSGRNLIATIKLALPFRMGYVNCYLLEGRDGYVLIDTGGSNRRAEIVGTLEQHGCLPGRLALICVTHGDFDHIGNAAFLRDHLGGRIAMHPADAPMAEQGDMFANRTKPNTLVRRLVPIFTGFGKAERFTPDILLEDGDDLSDHGLEAQVISIPGHSLGSIGLLTSTCDLFCGDLMENTKVPRLGSIMDDPATAESSLQKLRSRNIGSVYPGHGEPFDLHQLLSSS